VKTSQHVQVFGEMSVHDNVIVGTILHTTSLREARELAYKELEFLGLSHLAAASASDLTLASRARLELARALSLKPRLLMIDELMAGMSEVEVSEMLDLLKRINQERHVTLLVIEHNMRAIMKLSQRIIALIQGSLAADGDPQVVSHDPTVVEAYLGVV
jgi:branched-chain amino acid transport system ATP-binding protein